MISRRQFIRSAAVGLIGTAVSACQPFVIHIDHGTPAPGEVEIDTPYTPTSLPLKPTPTFSPDQLPEILSPQEAAFLAAHEIMEGDTTRPVVMMTYDDNAKYAQVRAILDAYNKHNAKATFFFIGEKIPLSAKAVRAVVEDGHTLGCHAWEHINLLRLNSEQVNRQIARCFEVVDEVVPGYRLRFIRFPYGEGTGNSRMLNICASWGLQHVCWTTGSGGLDSGTYDTVMRNAQNGAIFLSHMFRHYDVEQAGRIVDSLIDQGYSLESVETGRKPSDIYAVNTRMATDDGEQS